MDRQLASGLVVRGWLNPAYYTLGCDPGVSYMAAMGGWGVLDYALNFAPRPFDWLQLGYASYLSSWCLMNTGRPVPMVLTGDWDYPWRAELEVGPKGAKVELVRTDRRAIEKKNS